MSLVRLYALGVALDVDLAESGLDEAEFRRLWERCLEPHARVADVETVPVVRLRSTTYEGATQQITREFIEQQWGNLLMLHAGAVADPVTGRAIAYAAPGGTGKSTLSRLLGQRLGYLTDETVGIDPQTLQIRPYPKPLTWADVAGKAKREHAPESLGLTEAPKEASLTRLAVLRRTDGATASFTQLNTLDALEMLVPETSSLSKLPQALHLLADVFRQVGGVTLIEYGEAEDIVDWCVEALAEPRPSTESTGVRRSETPRRSDQPNTDQPDLLVVDAESAVLHGNRLLRLGPIATAIVQLMKEPHTVEELAAALEAQFGAPPDGGLIPAVEEQLRVLREHGVLSGS